jgi:hypothetical protein
MKTDDETPKQSNELDVNLETGEIIPEKEKKSFKTPEATREGSLKNVSKAASGDFSVPT